MQAPIVTFAADVEITILAASRDAFGIAPVLAWLRSTYDWILVAAKVADARVFPNQALLLVLDAGLDIAAFRATKGIELTRVVAWIHTDVIVADESTIALIIAKATLRRVLVPIEFALVVPTNKPVADRSIVTLEEHALLCLLVAPEVPRTPGCFGVILTSCVLTVTHAPVDVGKTRVVLVALALARWVGAGLYRTFVGALTIQGVANPLCLKDHQAGTVFETEVLVRLIAVDVCTEVLVLTTTTSIVAGEAAFLRILLVDTLTLYTMTIGTSDQSQIVAKDLVRTGDSNAWIRIAGSFGAAMLADAQ